MKKAETETRFEAMAAELSPRGTNYRLFDVEFPAGVWVSITDGMAKMLKWHDWAEVREVKRDG